MPIWLRLESRIVAEVMDQYKDREKVNYLLR